MADEPASVNARCGHVDRSSAGTSWDDGEVDIDDGAASSELPTTVWPPARRRIGAAEVGNAGSAWEWLVLYEDGVN